MPETWCVWMKVHNKGSNNEGFSKIAGDLTREQAEWMAETVYFQARAMKEHKKG